MKKLFMLLPFIVTAQAHAFTFTTAENTLLTSEAKALIAQYAQSHCTQVEALKENSTSFYSQNNSHDFKLGAYVDFYFSNNENFDRTEIMITERRNADGSWSAEISSVSSHSDNCQSL